LAAPQFQFSENERKETMKSIFGRFCVTAVVVVGNLGLITATRTAFAGEGCTGVPEYYFHTACEIHDECYDTGRSIRTDCDKEFLHNMKTECESNPDADACKSMATIYYLGVRLGAACHYMNGSECEIDHSSDPIVSGDPFANDASFWHTGEEGRTPQGYDYFETINGQCYHVLCVAGDGTPFCKNEYYVESNSPC
jgi:hypothetical protein